MDWRVIVRRARDGSFFGAVRHQVRAGVVRPLRKDLVRDLAVLVGSTEVATVVDVGAHHGSMTEAFLAAFPRSTVLAVEADPRSIGVLRGTVAHDPRCEVVAAAASAVDGGEASFHATATGTTSSLLRPTGATAEVVVVPTVTIDAECERRGIDRIDVLKVDVEGAELEVLAGCRGLLERSAIDVVVAEARLVRETEGGVLLPDLAVALAAHGYRMHNLYGEVESRALGIIYANAVFVGPRFERALLDRWGEAALVQRYGWHG